MTSGDISWKCSDGVSHVSANIPHLPGHSWANAVAMATPMRIKVDGRRQGAGHDRAGFSAAAGTG